MFLNSGKILDMVVFKMNLVGSGEIVVLKGKNVGTVCKSQRIYSIFYAMLVTVCRMFNLSILMGPYELFHVSIF